LAAEPQGRWAAYREVVVLLRVLGEIAGIEVIAVGGSIRELRRIEKAYGSGRWRKLKGRASVELPDGTIEVAEVHWYESHGIGRREVKIKRLLR
jgi:hypothetical protein